MKRQMRKPCHKIVEHPHPVFIDTDGNYNGIGYEKLYKVCSDTDGLMDRRQSTP
jgi:hypothetical protein